jgi:SAM-dependent methyltransferase
LTPFVKVSSELHQSDIEGSKTFYQDSSVQPFFYDHRPPLYASLISELISSMRPNSVLEFGCNAGRNLALIKRRLSKARLVGMDLNRTAIAAGRRAFRLDLRVADENSLATIPDSSFDVSFTVSVLDHISVPEETIAQLSRISRGFVITYEICHEQTGRIELMQDPQGRVVDGYPFSYFHDYRKLFAQAGCWLVLDAAVPAFVGNLGEFYRLQIHARRESDFGENLLQRVLFRRLQETAVPRPLRTLRKQASRARRFLGSVRTKGTVSA